MFERPCWRLVSKFRFWNSVVRQTPNWAIGRPWASKNSWALGWALGGRKILSKAPLGAQWIFQKN
jgi:hypothetical protein